MTLDPQLRGAWLIGRRPAVASPQQSEYGNGDGKLIVMIIDARLGQLIQDNPNYFRRLQVLVTFLDLRDRRGADRDDKQNAIYLRQNCDNIVAG